MPYTMEQFRKDYLKAHLPEMDTDEVLSMFTPKDRLKGLAPKDRLKGLTPKDRLEGGFDNIKLTSKTGFR